MILSDKDIKALLDIKALVLKGMNDETIRENGVDLRISNEVAQHVFNNQVLDITSKADLAKEYRVTKVKKCVLLLPLNSYLLSTKEYVKMPKNVMGFVEVRSTFARHGLLLPPTINDAGFEGNVTIEVFNTCNYSISVPVGTRFIHIIFAKTLTSSTGYGGKYHKQHGLTTPRLDTKDTKTKTNVDIAQEIIGRYF